MNMRNSLLGMGIYPSSPYYSTTAMSDGIKTLAGVTGKQLDNRLMLRKLVTHQKMNE